MPRKEARESFYVCRDANCIFLFAAARDLVKREKGDQKNVFRKKKKTHFVKQYVQHKGFYGETSTKYQMEIIIRKSLKFTLHNALILKLSSG